MQNNVLTNIFMFEGMDSESEMYPLFVHTLILNILFHLCFILWTIVDWITKQWVTSSSTCINFGFDGFLYGVKISFIDQYHFLTLKILMGVFSSHCNNIIYGGHILAWFSGKIQTAPSQLLADTICWYSSCHSSLSYVKEGQESSATMHVFFSSYS